MEVKVVDDRELGNGSKCLAIIVLTVAALVYYAFSFGKGFMFNVLFIALFVFVAGILFSMSRYEKSLKVIRKIMGDFSKKHGFEAKNGTDRWEGKHAGTEFKLSIMPVLGFRSLGPRYLNLLFSDFYLLVETDRRAYGLEGEGGFIVDDHCVYATIRDSELYEKSILESMELISSRLKKA